jgi:hypothetical protein
MAVDWETGVWSLKEVEDFSLKEVEDFSSLLCSGAHPASYTVGTGGVLSLGLSAAGL